MSSVTTDAFPFGLIPAQTFSFGIPTCSAIAKAVFFPSPVIMHTSTPICCNTLIACLELFFGASASEIATTGSGVLVDEAIET